MGTSCSCDPCKKDNSISKINDENENFKIMIHPSLQNSPKSNQLSVRKNSKYLEVNINDHSNSLKFTEENKMIVNENKFQTSTSTNNQNDGENFQIKWKKGELIGSGAYGKVYLGLNVYNGQMIAIKSIQLSPDKVSAANEMKDIKQEIELIKKLDHPNIIKYIYADISKIDQRVDIILEYMPAGSLKSLVEKFGSLNEKIIQIYTKQILEGLKYVHKNGIIHRDLKCANILLDNDANIKISDFGAATFIDRDLHNDLINFCRSIKGSIYWVSPEVANKSGYISTTDIWGLGCVVLEMISGKHPWSEIEDSIENLLQMIAKSTKGPKYPEDISLNLKEFLDQCFIIDKIKRPDAEKLLEHPFICKINQEESSQLMLHMSLAISNFNSIMQGTQANESNLPNNSPSKKMPKCTTKILNEYKLDKV